MKCGVKHSRKLARGFRNSGLPACHFHPAGCVQDLVAAFSLSWQMRRRMGAGRKPGQRQGQWRCSPKQDVAAAGHPPDMRTRNVRRLFLLVSDKKVYAKKDGAEAVDTAGAVRAVDIRTLSFDSAASPSRRVAVAGCLCQVCADSHHRCHHVRLSACFRSARPGVACPGRQTEPRESP